MTKHKLINYLLLISLMSTSLFAENIQLKSPTLNLQIDSKTGGVQSIVNEQDKYQMNWIIKSDSLEYPWQTAKLAWGLGYGVVNGDTVRWNKSVSQTSVNNQSLFRYHTRYFDLVVERTISSNGICTESY
ncbi:MAG: hypothetical protein Q8909_04905, partial [Bacteroidota bacterium]|nr:hypothetical protein [Bacteroidota bacterium]